MREERGLDGKAIAACLAAHYRLDVGAVTFLPIGSDFQAAVYRVAATDGTDYFLKIRFGPVFEPGLLVPRALVDLGIANILAPLRTTTAALWCPLDGHEGSTVVLYPCIRGENAKRAGLSAEQWRAFSATLRAVHASGLEARFRGLLHGEDFTLPAAAIVHRLLADLDGATFDSPAAARFAQFWRDHAARIEGLLARAEALGGGLRGKTFAHVLCHADIHGANILAGANGRIWLVDWDGPLIAPRERDLLFVVGSRIGRPVTPREEDLFFASYGPVEIETEALAYYRYERRIEDLCETGMRVFRDPHLSERAREEQAEATMAFFTPGGDLDVAETVPSRRWPRIRLTSSVWSGDSSGLVLRSNQSRRQRCGAPRSYSAMSPSVVITNDMGGAGSSRAAHPVSVSDTESRPALPPQFGPATERLPGGTTA